MFTEYSYNSNRIEKDIELNKPLPVHGFHFKAVLYLKFKRESKEEVVVSKKDSQEKQERNNKTIRALAQFSHIGVVIAASIFIGVMIGKYLDAFLGTSPWFLLIFSLLGIGAAFKSLLDIPKEEEKKK